MSGFLHRLAALAIGSRNSTLHSLARMPYAIPYSSVYNEESDRQSATLGTRGQPITNSDVELTHLTDQSQPNDGFHTKIDAQDRKNEMIPSSPEALIAQPATGFTTTPDLEIAPSSLRSRLRQPETRVKNTAADASAVNDEAIKTHNLLNNSGTNPIVYDEPYATLTDSAIPPPLLPLKNNTAQPSVLSSSIVARRGEPRDTAWKSQVEETTEVHVSIGRIEVTAVHEAEPPKRQTPTTAKSMTLDEYLARRQRQA